MWFRNAIGTDVLSLCSRGILVTIWLVTIARCDEVEEITGYFVVLAQLLGPGFETELLGTFGKVLGFASGLGLAGVRLTYEISGFFLMTSITANTTFLQ